MTTVTVQQQSVQRVTVTPTPSVTVTVTPTGPKGDKGDKGEDGGLIVIGTTDKQTGVDAGFLHEMSIVDDYLYVCVKAGTAETAIWKRTILFTT